MDRRIVCRQWIGVLISVLACWAVAYGQSVYTQGANFHVGGSLDVDGDLDVDDDVTVGFLESSSAVWCEDMWADDDVDAYWVGYYTEPYGIFGTLTGNDCEFWDVDAYTISAAKITSSGGYDPPYVLYDKQSREQIIERVRNEVAPEKQEGAALFFNKDTHKLETYVPAEGKFYDLQGTVVHAITPVGTAPYETIHYLDASTGQIATRQETVSNRYKVRRGYRLDEKTGRFVNAKTGEAVPREQALSVYVAKEGKSYDLQGNLIPAPRRPTAEKSETVYYLDSLTGEVKTRSRDIHDRYVVKSGFGLDRKTGQFVEIATGQVVAKETAVEIKRAAPAQPTR